MVISYRGIFHGCSTAFVHLVSMVLTAEEMENGPGNRHEDFMELFAGKANLSSALRDATCLQFVFAQVLLNCITPFFSARLVSLDFRMTRSIMPRRTFRVTRASCNVTHSHFLV